MALSKDDCIEFIMKLASNPSVVDGDKNNCECRNVEDINPSREGKLDQLARMLPSRDFTDLHTGID